MNIKSIFSVDFKKLLSSIPLKKLGYTLGAIILVFGAITIYRSYKTEKKNTSNLYFIGRDPSFYPLQLFGKEKNFLAFTNDLLATIATDENMRFEWIDTSSALLLEGLDEGHYDAAITTMRPHIANQEKYIFSEMYFELGPVLVVNKKSTLKNLKDLEGLSIGIYEGLSLIFNAVRETGANIYTLTFVTYSSNNKVLEALVKGQIDAAIIPAIPAYTLVQSFYPNSLKIVTTPLADDGVRLVALQSERSQELMNRFDASFEKITDNGTFKNLIKKWNLTDPSVQPAP